MKASGGIGFVVHVGEIRDGARAAGGAADALELPVRAAGAAVKVLDVAVLGRRMHRREVGKPAADGADERTVVVRHVVGTIDRGRGLRGESVEMGAKRKAENGEDVVGEKVVAFGRFFHAVEIVGRARTGDLDEVGRRKARPVDRLHRVGETPFGVGGVVEHDGEFPNDLFEFRRIDRDGAVGEERAVGADERLFDARLLGQFGRRKATGDFADLEERRAEVGEAVGHDRVVDGGVLKNRFKRTFLHGVSFCGGLPKESAAHGAFLRAVRPIGTDRFDWSPFTSRDPFQR